MSEQRIRVVGVSALALASIPWVIGLAASTFLGFTITLRGFGVTLSQENRRAVYVGAAIRPKDPIKIMNLANGSVEIERVDIEDDSLVVYLHNKSHERRCFINLHYSFLSPDGTAIITGQSYPGDETYGIGPGEREEDKETVKVDDRSAILRLEVTSKNDCS